MANDRKAFWSNVDEAVSELSAACGCYVYTLRGRAWYVGRAERQTFKAECYTPHKVMLYNDALDSVGGDAALIFVAERTLQNRFTSPTVRSIPAVRMLEDRLIGLAVARNEKLLNIRGTKFLRNMRVPGVINTGSGGARAAAVKALKKSLGV
jgi:hypothetical protein